MKLGLLSIFVVLTAAQRYYNQCNRVVTELGQEIQRRQYRRAMDQALPFVQLSGTGPNRWGDYEACLRNESMRYVNVEITANDTVQYMGTCVSAQCTAEDLQQQAPQIQSRLSQELNADVALQFTDPSTAFPEVGFPLFITCLYLMILLSLTLVQPISTLIKIFGQNLELPSQYQKINIQVNEGSEKGSIDPTSSIGYNYASITQMVNMIIKSSTIEEQVIKIKQDQEDLKREKSFFEQISIAESYDQLFTLNTPDSNLSIFNGLRAVALVMVVIGHQFGITIRQADGQQFLIQVRTFDGLLLVDCLYSVDIFLWIGGFFTGFVMVETKKRMLISKQGFKGILLVILHRVLRIWPCYITTMLIVSNIAPYLGGGPRWFFTTSILQCDTWWRNLLFIDNLFDDGKYCMVWSWYLSCDMQLFIISLIPIYVYAKHSPNLAKKIIIGLLIVTQIIGLIICCQKSYTWFYSFLQQEFFEFYYYKAWCRGPTYFIGLFLGILYREYKISKVQNSNPNTSDQPILVTIQSWSQSSIKISLLKFSSYLIGFGIMAIVSFGWRDYQLSEDYWPKSYSLFWNSTSRSIYVIGLSLVTLACILGYKDFFNEQIMNCTLFKFLSKISFTCYMLHYMVITATTGNFYEHVEFTMFSQIQFFIGNMIITVFLATLMTLIVEMPFVKIEQLIQDKLLPKRNVIQDRLLG